MTGTPDIAFVVPTKDSARTLERCLRSIRAQEDVRIELIVVDNSSRDETPQIAARYSDEFLGGGPERSAQRNAGLTCSGAPAVVFIDSDMVLEPRVGVETVRALARDAALGALVLPERAFGEGFLARCRALEKELYLGDPAVEAARAFRREALEEVGGYDITLTGPEDWELPDRVLRRGWAVGRTKSGVWHDEGRVHLLQQFAKKRYYGRGVYHYRRQVNEVPRRPVARGSLLQPAALSRDPLHAVGLGALKVVELAGLLVGVLDERARVDRR